MSTLLGGQHHEILKSENDLAHYFEAHAKPAHELKAGLEAEFLGIERDSGQALSYEGPHGIHQIFKTLAREFGYEPVLDAGNIIALVKGDSIISLEPGGQTELSAPPVSNVFEIADQIEAFLKQLREMEKRYPVKWLAVGIQPFSKLDEISWVPKRRYQIMAEHLGKRGTLSRHMMKRTATNQLNIDYTDEKDAMAKLRVALGITSLVSALFANASFSEGRPNGYASYRLEIWNQTDPERTGLIPEFLRPGKTFKDYLEYVLKMPMIFMVRGDEWIPVKGISFRDFIRKGYQGHRATLGDFELHLSTAFPEARFKQYLEVRGTDCQSPTLIPAVAAFWKGILYDEDAREKAWNLVSFASEEDHLRLHRAVPREGLKAQLAGKPVFPLAESLVEIACEGLGRQQKEENMERNECYFLEVIREKILRPGKSPGETLIEKWNGEFGRQPQKLIQYLEI